ncbi:MAG: hypothetical protein FJ214_08120 [Ignavibacteria bacterium]|nr:hypothetical protein [Ignavibacteria bacterium]
MAFIDIKKTDLTHIQKIDAEHQQMALFINQLYSSAKKSDFHDTYNIFKNFLSATNEHFFTEETLMKENNYQGYFSHKLEHDRVIKKLKSIDEQFYANINVINAEELSNLKKWFFNHLELSDKKLGAFLIEKVFR